MIKLLFLITIIFLLAVIFYDKKFYLKKNNKVKIFKDKLTSKESRIEKIFQRSNERLIKDPSINIIIDIYEKEENINLKTNIHRARLAKFRKSKLNGEYIYIDENNKIYKMVNEKKDYIL